MIYTTNSAKGLENAMDSHKYIIIKFTASWCGPCRKMSPEIHSLSLQFNGLHFIEIDIDDIDDAVLTTYEVTSIPKIISVAHGEIKDEVTGCDINKVQKMVNSLNGYRKKCKSERKVVL